MTLPICEPATMLYSMYDAAAAAMYPARMWARGASTLLRHNTGPDYLTWPARAAVAWADVADDVLRPRGKPEWNIKAERGSERARDRGGRARPAIRPPGPVRHERVGAPPRAAGGADERASRDAAAWHRAGHDRHRARGVRHRLAGRADRAAAAWRLRPRQLHRDDHPLHAASRPRHACRRRVPAGAGGGGGRFAHGGATTTRRSRAA